MRPSTQSRRRRSSVPPCLHAPRPEPSTRAVAPRPPQSGRPSTGCPRGYAGCTAGDEDPDRDRSGHWPSSGPGWPTSSLLVRSQRRLSGSSSCGDVTILMLAPRNNSTAFASNWNASGNRRSAKRREAFRSRTTGSYPGRPPPPRFPPPTRNPHGENSALPRRGGPTPYTRYAFPKAAHARLRSWYTHRLLGAGAKAAPARPQELAGEGAFAPANRGDWPVKSCPIGRSFPTSRSIRRIMKRRNFETCSGGLRRKS